MSESSSTRNKANQAGAVAFQIFCACIFLGMIGLVFLNAVLRYCFNSGYPPSEEWARFLFIYITFFGAIEAFYRKKHIAVEMVVDLLQGNCRKVVNIIAILLTIAALVVLLQGGRAVELLFRHVCHEGRHAGFRSIVMRTARFSRRAARHTAARLAPK